MNSGPVNVQGAAAGDVIERLLADDAFGARLSSLRSAGKVLVIESGRPTAYIVHSQTVIIRPAAGAPGQYSIAGIRIGAHSIATEKTRVDTPLYWNDAARAILRNILGSADDWMTTVTTPSDYRVQFVRRFTEVAGS